MEKSDILKNDECISDVEKTHQFLFLTERIENEFTSISYASLADSFDVN